MIRHIKIIFTDDKGKKITILDDDFREGSTYNISLDVQPHFEPGSCGPAFLYYTGRKDFTLHIPEDPEALYQEMAEHDRKLKKS